MATVGVKELFMVHKTEFFPLPASAIVAFFARDIFSSVYEHDITLVYEFDPFAMYCVAASTTALVEATSPACVVCCLSNLAMSRDRWKT